jgi:hypothetical protein
MEKKITLSEQLQNLIESSCRQRQNDISNTQIHDRSLSWLRTGSSIKNGGDIWITSISILLWWSVLLIGESGVSGKKIKICHRSLTNFTT